MSMTRIYQMDANGLHGRNDEDYAWRGNDSPFWIESGFNELDDYEPKNVLPRGTNARLRSHLIL